MRRCTLVWLFGALLASASGAADFEVDANTKQIVFKTLAGFDKCVLDLAEIPACLEALRNHATKRPNDAFQAGKRAGMHYPAWTALPFFEIALRKRATDAQCSDADVLMAVTAGLSRPNSDAESLRLAREVADRCWESMQDGLIEALPDANDTLQTNACALLTDKGVAATQCSASANAGVDTANQRQ